MITEDTTTIARKLIITEQLLGHKTEKCESHEV